MSTEIVNGNEYGIVKPMNLTYSEIAYTVELVKEYKKLSKQERIDTRDNYRNIVKECSLKVSLSSACLGRFMKKATVESLLTVYPKLEFIERKKGYQLKNTGTMKDNLSLRDFIEVANRCNLQRTKRQRLINLYTSLPEKIGNDKAETETEINSILNLSPEWINIRGTSYDLKDYSSDVNNRKLQTRISRNQLRIKEYRLKISCLSFIASLENFKEASEAYNKFANELGVTTNDLKGLFE